MPTRSGCIGFAVLMLLLSACATQPSSLLWRVDSLETIGGLPVTVEGNPRRIDSPHGPAMYFDGDGDRLVLDVNPLGDAREFTIEILFRPDDAYPANTEPRFFHIEDPNNPDRRITIELRLNDQQQWYLDAYIKSEISQYTLIDPTLVHPVEQWAHAAITYRDRQFVSYVNGKRELTAQVDYLPIGVGGKTSIGARMNRVHWFKGSILAVRITPEVIAPDQFYRPF